MIQKKPDREDLQPGQVLCDFCTAKCCRYFALPIDAPDDIKDFDYIRWYLLHQHASVFTEDETWYLLVHTRCKHLQSDNRWAFTKLGRRSAVSTRRTTASMMIRGLTTTTSRHRNRFRSIAKRFSWTSMIHISAVRNRLRCRSSTKD